MANNSLLILSDSEEETRNTSREIVDLLTDPEPGNNDYRGQARASHEVQILSDESVIIERSQNPANSNVVEEDMDSSIIIIRKEEAAQEPDLDISRKKEYGSSDFEDNFEQSIEIGSNKQDENNVLEENTANQSDPLIFGSNKRDLFISDGDSSSEIEIVDNNAGNTGLYKTPKKNRHYDPRDFLEEMLDDGSELTLPSEDFFSRKLQLVQKHGEKLKIVPQKDEDKLFISSGSDSEQSPSKQPLRRSKTEIRPYRKLTLLSSSQPDPIDTDPFSLSLPKPRKPQEIPTAEDDDFLKRFSKKDLAKANKASMTKEEKAKEMKIVIDEHIFEKLKLDVELLTDETPQISVSLVEEVLKEHSQSIKALKGLQLDGVALPLEFTKFKFLPQFTLHLMLFKKTTTRLYSTSRKCFLPLETSYGILQDVAVVFIAAEELLETLESGEFYTQLARLKSLFSGILDQVVVAAYKYPELLSKARRRVNQEYTKQIRNEILRESQEPQSRKKRKSGPIMTEEQIEAHVTDLTIGHGVHFFPVLGTADLISWVRSMAYSTNLSFYEKNSVTNWDASSVLGRFKTGKTSEETLSLALQQMKYVTKNKAEKMAAHYKNLYKMAKEVVEHKSVIADNEGRALANSGVTRTMLVLFGTANPDELLHEES